MYNNIPIYFFINKADLETANINKCINDIENILTRNLFFADSSVNNIFENDSYIEWLCNYDDIFMDANTVFTCTNSGKYYVSYSIKTTAGLLLSSTVRVNGTSNASLECEPGLLATEYSGQAIISLNNGDSLQLTMYGLLGTAVLQDGAGATMNVIRKGNSLTNYAFVNIIK